MTKIYKVNPQKPENSILRMAADIIKRNRLVAFPTETVYGLGADALNSNAVKKIFFAKERPMDNPLIVHIADKDDIYNLAKNREIKRKNLSLKTDFYFLHFMLELSLENCNKFMQQLR